MIDAGRATVDGTPRARSFAVRGGMRIDLTPAPAPEPVVPPPLPPVRYEDEDVVVLAKPVGLVVHQGHGHVGDTLVDALRASGRDLAAAGGAERPGIVHRLDRDTSGLMVVAKSDAAYVGLVAQLKRRAVERSYLAVVEGRLPGPHGRVEIPIGRDPRNPTRMAGRHEGKHAVTHWEVAAEGAAPTAPPTAVSAVWCRLETGRTHQIRVHLSHAGHPVVGDDTYGARPDVAAALEVERQLLHALRLAFTHPVTGEPIEVVDDLPDDFKAAIRLAGLDGLRL